mgnify:CR=1 FL=1
MAEKKKSTVNAAGNYTKPTMRKKQFSRIKSGKPSIQGPDATGEVYAPAATLKATKRSKLAAATRAKRKATREGKQHAKHGLHKGKKR